MHSRISFVFSLACLPLLFIIAGFFECPSDTILPTSDEETAQAVYKLKQQPKEDILQHPEVKDYLSKHKVYVSLTTSPLRLPKILPVLQTIDLEYIDTIFLVLPEKYRNQENYGPIPHEIAQFPKLKILQPSGSWPKNWSSQDLGPIMKLLPAMKWIKQLGDEQALLITIDDDIGQPQGLVGQLVKNSILTRDRKGILGVQGMNVATWGVDKSNWPAQDAKPCTLNQNTALRTLIERNLHA